MKKILFTLVMIIMVSTTFSQTWLKLGGGWGGDEGLASRISIESVIAKKHLVTISYTGMEKYVYHVGMFGGQAGFEKTTWIKEYGVLYGRIKKFGNWGFISGSVGLSIVHYNVYWNLSGSGTLMNDWQYNTHSIEFTTMGIPINFQFVVGGPVAVSTMLFANINGERTYGGVLLGLHFRLHQGNN